MTTRVWMGAVQPEWKVTVTGAPTDARDDNAPLDAADEAGHFEHPADALVRRARAAEVRAAIARLPKKQRATLILRVYHELPHEQIARILGSSLGAVKANFFHALNNLKKLLRHA